MSSSPGHKRAADNDVDDSNNKRKRTTTRRGAGKRSLPAGFVDSEQAITKDPIDDSTSDSELDDEDQHVRLSHKRRGRSPPPPDLEEDPQDVDSSTISVSTSSTTLSTPSSMSSVSSTTSTPSQMSLSFHVPPGHEGPFVVNLQLPAGLSNNASSSSLSSGGSSSGTRFAIDKTLLGPRRKPFNVKRQPVTFLDLPAELRNDIYKRVVVTPNVPIVFAGATNFGGHCAALLRTCKVVYEEARQFLYGEHEFHFSRCNRDRGNFWEKWTEVGWKDVRRFLVTIGPHNIAQLRKIQFSLQDSNDLRNSPFPRFATDDHLLECFKLLSQHGALETISLDFHGRAIVKAENERFIYHLKAVQADEVKIVGASDEGNGVTVRHIRGWGYQRTWSSKYGDAKIHRTVGKDLVEKMKRKEALYS